LGYQGGPYLGGQDISQVFVRTPWNNPDVAVLGGKQYSQYEVIKPYPIESGGIAATPQLVHCSSK